MAQPSVDGLPKHLLHAARAVAERLEHAGFRGWVVGGAVRDLALGRVVHDLDMVSAATPDEIERTFERTIPVGRAFGTVVLPMGGCEVQLTTFRTESGYSDRRRPDHVRFGTSLEEDAQRRDFTCNALYLDPLTDELRDPAGGLPDLERRLLRTVGDPADRFREDGLRLLRLARFEAVLELSPAAGLHRAARAEGAALVGVSVERVLGELTRLFEGPRSPRGMAVLAECELLGRILPLDPLSPAEPFAHRLAVHGRLPDPPGAALGLACWLDAAPPESGGEALAALTARAEESRLSRALIHELTSLWRLARRLPELDRAARSERVLAMRDATWSDAVHLARAREPGSAARLDALAAERAELGPAGLHPSPWITPRELARSGLAPGPAWGELLAEAERLQLDGAWSSPDEARAWLRARVERTAG